MLRSRRFALIAAATLLGLSACGDSNPRTTPASTLAVIHLGAGSASTNGAAPAEAATADRMMVAMDVTYVIDGEIADLGATGPAWTLPGGASPDLTRVAEIARLLGVDGEVRELPADQGGGWMVGADDYSTATLSVSADGLLSWWYNPAPQPVADTAVAECVYPVDDVQPATSPDTSPDTGDVTSATSVALPECEEPQPPTNVPDEAGARALADQLFAAMGYDVAGLDDEVYADEWGASVTASLLLDGQRSPITLSAGFGADGALTWASGSLATPERAGDYPLVGIDAGLTRLNDETGRWSGYWGGAALMARTDVVADEASATAEVPPQVGDTVPIESPVCDPAADCVPETYAAPEPITVHLTAATLGLTMVWAQDGTIWLLPAYTFTDADGGQYTVVAVDDAFVDLPDPTDTMPIDTMLIDTVPIDTLPADTMPADTMPVDTAAVTVSS